MIGREKNKDHDEIKPTLALTFALNKKEVDKYRKRSDGFHESQRACLKLREISTVETSVTDFRVAITQACTPLQVLHLSVCPVQVPAAPPSR